MAVVEDEAPEPDIEVCKIRCEQDFTWQHDKGFEFDGRAIAEEDGGLTLEFTLYSENFPVDALHFLTFVVELAKETCLLVYVGYTEAFFPLGGVEGFLIRQKLTPCQAMTDFTFFRTTWAPWRTFQKRFATSISSMMPNSP